jgi:integrase
MATKRFYIYAGPNGQKLHGYQRKYKHHRLRKKGFTSKSEAEDHLRQAMNDIDAVERGEVRSKPTTAQDALNIYKRNLEIRSKDKASQYRHNVNSNCKVLQEFVDRFGPDRLVRECTETDLRDFYQTLCFRPTLSKNSAAVFVGRVQGMLKAAQKAKPDLVNWLRPTLSVKRKTEFERRSVEPQEYGALVSILLDPPLAPSRRAERKALWREAGDAVQLLRLTGGRLNEVLRMSVSQLNFSKRTIRLYATKTENERDVPMTQSLHDLLQLRIREGLMSDGLVFPRAETETFDNAIQRACRKAAKLAKLNYGQANGFTLHSFRHTFITDLLLKTRDIAGVMRLSGHRSLQSFSTYLHLLDTGFTNAVAVLESVGPFLAPSENTANSENEQSTDEGAANLLQIKQVAL